MTPNIAYRNKIMQWNTFDNISKTSWQKTVACYFCLDDFHVIVRAKEKEPKSLFPQHLLIYAHDPVCCMDDRLETMDWNISSSGGGADM